MCRQALFIHSYYRCGIRFWFEDQPTVAQHFDRIQTKHGRLTCCCVYTCVFFNQPTNQPINQPTNQPTNNQSINQPTNNQSANQPTTNQLTIRTYPPDWPPDSGYYWRHSADRSVGPRDASSPCEKRCDAGEGDSWALQSTKTTIRPCQGEEQIAEAFTYASRTEICVNIFIIILRFDSDENNNTEWK